MNKLGKIGLWVGLVFLYTPIFFLIVFSFNEASYPGIWTGFSLRWYKTLFSNQQVFHCLINSFKIATISAFISVFLGTIAAIRIVKSRLRFIKTLLLTPLATPEIIVGFSLLLLIVAMRKIIGWPQYYGVQTIIIGHVTLTIGYVIMIVLSRLKDFDTHLEEAALNLGATPLQTFYYITLPIIMPSLFSAWLLSFALSLDDVVLASFLSGPGATTLPMLIFSNLRMGITPELNALASMIILVISSIVILISLVFRKKI
jgi:putrescine transport system permease protein